MYTYAVLRGPPFDSICCRKMCNSFVFSALQLLSLPLLPRDAILTQILCISLGKKRSIKRGPISMDGGRREANPFFVIGLPLLLPLGPSGDSDSTPSDPQGRRSCTPDRCTRTVVRSSSPCVRPTCDSPDSVRLGDRPRLMAAWAPPQDGQAHAAAMQAPRSSLSVVRSSDGAEFPLHRDDFRNITT